MKRHVALLLLPFLLAICPSPASGQTISGPEVRLVNNDLFVTGALVLDEKHVQEVRNGIEKELRIYVDLFKIWKIWPDEFVLGKSFVRTLRADQVKQEYVATSNDGSVNITRRFKSFESMMDWTLTLKDFKLTNVRELEPGTYFVKVTVESKVRKLPPVIGYIFMFISENEFKAVRDSAVFTIEGTP